ncbi:MAG: hypothetical protein OEV74_04605 [Cyclobacteriaceae bacterium]|jgi:hypothetical protein|nr:hypothetical protein [Cyclobacteriaceae bacterium]MDH4295539.1 hypothetical protein [Cyclobacteriaceae bacterium]MDH5247964.1 hypothetical protein [Cyclobacteriaceae bacterium]
MPMDVGAILILVGIALTAVMLKTFYDRGKKALSIFPHIDSVHVLYRDKTAFGYSTKSWQTKIGGASRSLDIVVTDKELWLKSFLLFAGITQQHDLLHKIPLNRITKVKENGPEITLDFRNEKGQSKQIVINTKDKIEFLKSIRK